MRRTTHRVPQRRRIDPVLVGLLLLGLALRLWYLSVHNHRSAFFADEGDYYARAIRMAFGDGYVDDFWLIRPPLVVFWLATIFKGTALLGWPEHIVLVTRLVQIVLSLGVLVLLYDTGQLLAGRTAGRWAAGGWAVIYSFVRLPSLLLVENIFLALVALVFWALARYERRPAAQRYSWSWLALAGLGLGLAALARSTLLWFLPVILLWLWLIERRRQPSQRVRFAPVMLGWLLVTGLTLLTILPWTLRNYQMYQRIILVDTMLGANLWLDADEVDSRRGDNPKLVVLQAIADPVARDAYGRERGLATILAHPVSKLIRSWAQIRHALRLEFMANFFDRSSLDSEPLRRVWPLALPGDLLTVALIMLLIWSSFNPATAGPFKVGALLWISLNLAAIVVFHSETRYLLPIYQTALILGGVAIAQARVHVAGSRLAASLAAMFGVLLIIMTYKPYPALLDQGLEREFALADGWAAYRAGEWQLAQAAGLRAQRADPDFDEPYWLQSLALAAQDGPEAGLAPINTLLAQNSREPHAHLIRAHLLQQLGRHDEVANPASLETGAPEDLLSWSFDYFRSPPTTTLLLDGQHDLGYVRGWWPAEEGRRRAMERAEVRLLVPTNATPQLTLYLYAPSTVPAEPVRVLVDGVEVGSFEPGRTWNNVQFLLPAALAGREVVVTLIGPTAVEAGGAPGTDQLREAGIEVVSVSTQ